MKAKIETILQVLQNSLNCLAWLPPLMARITLAGVFIESGWGKIHNIEKVTEYFTSLGIPAAGVQAHFVAYLECVGGVFILLGLLTRIISVPLLFTMGVAILTAKREDLKEFTDLFGFSEFLYIVLFVGLIISGAGKASLDFLLFRKLNVKPSQGWRSL